MGDIRVRVQRSEYQHVNRGHPQCAPDLEPASILEQHGKRPDEWKTECRSPPSSARPHDARDLPQIEQADDEPADADGGLAGGFIPVTHRSGFLERRDRTAVQTKVLDER